MTETPSHDIDPILARRARIARVVGLAKRVGYTALLVGIVAFVIGAFTSFPSWTVTVSVVGLVASCVILPAPIVLGYGIRKAEREDPGRGPAR
ncbi:MAG: hypothetical protein U0V73_13390 [Acidimicrobiia bacterium]